MSPTEIVEFIESELKRQQMTKTEFYTRTGVSAAMFSNWRAGKNRPSLDALDSVNNVLHTSFSIGIETKNAPLFSAEAKELIDIYSDMTTDGQIELMNYAHYLKDKYTKKDYQHSEVG